MKHIARIFMLMLAIITFATTSAEEQKTVIRLKTSAEVGEILRIYMTPYNSQTVTGGVENSDFFGEYKVTDPTKDIVIEGDVDNLECYGCSLTDIIFENAPKLQILSCYDNKLTSLDLSSCKSLVNVNCKNNMLSEIDVTENENIESLICNHNNINSLKLGELAKLKTIDCGYNNLEEVDPSGCPALVDFYAEHNMLTNVNLSKNTNLWWIKVHCNNIADEMTSFVENLPQASQGMSMLYIVDTRDENEKNIAYVNQINTALEKGWYTCNYLGGMETSENMIGTIYKGCDYVPVYGDNTIRLITNKEVGEKIKIMVASSKDVLIDGVEEEAPYIGEQEYTIKSQEIIIKGDLDKFGCAGNEISLLEFSGEENMLTEINCSDNELTILDLKDMKKLEKLECQENKLEQLTLIGCDALLRVNCYRNNLKGAYMSMFMQSLYDDTKKTEKNEPALFLVDSKAPADKLEGNVCYKDDVKIAKDKGWRVKDYINGEMWGFGQDIEGEEKELPKEYAVIGSKSDYVSINLTMKHEGEMPIVVGADIVSWNGTILMIKMKEGSDAMVYGDFTSLLLPLASIDKLDVTNLPSLESLVCGFNNIETLDLSKNKNLKMLSCEGNNLKFLDLSETQLSSLICYANYFEGEKMTALVNSLPSCTKEDKGLFVVVDPTYMDAEGNVNEHNICLKSDIEKAAAKFWITCDLNGSAENIREYNGYDGDYVSPGLGGVYGLKELSKMFGSGIENNGDMKFNLTKKVIISDNDKFILEDNAEVTVQDRAIMEFHGDAQLTPEHKASFKIVGQENGEWSGLDFKCENNPVSVKNIDFEGLVLKCSSKNGFEMENCSVIKAPDCKLSKHAAINITFAEQVTISNCTFKDNQGSAMATGANSMTAVTVDGCTLENNSTTNHNHPQINLSVAEDKPIIVTNNVVIGNPEHTMVGGISVSNMLGVKGENNVIISGNTVTDNRYGITVLGNLHAVIKDNILKDNNHDPNPMNGGSGISLYDTNKKGPKLTAHIEGNSIEGHLWGITVIGCKEVNVGKLCVEEDAEDYNRGGNVFKNNGNSGQLYDLYNNSTSEVYAQGNIWNVEEQTKEAIEEVIFHKNDDPNLGEVFYWYEDMSGIEDVVCEDYTEDDIESIYNASGVKLNNFTNGMNIIRLKDGTVKKIFIR